MPSCEHSEVCNLDAIKGHDGKCILHSADPKKNEETFTEALKEHRKKYGADFRWMVFPVKTEFEEGTTLVGSLKHTTFLQPVCFEGVMFQPSSVEDDRIEFTKVTFKEKAIFAGATFNWRADFSGATFHGIADFSGATFEKGASFFGSSFKEVSFMGTVFRKSTKFYDAFDSHEVIEFEKAYFSLARLQGDVEFVGKSPEERIFANGIVEFHKANRKTGSVLSFKYADLRQCYFTGTDLEDVDFIGVRWCEAVSSDGWIFGEWFDRIGIYDEIAKTNHIESSDDEVFVGKRPWPEIERAYRQLKQNYEDRGDFSRAGDFHIGEKVARRQNSETNWGMRLLLTIYRTLSKYGERALPATFWLIGLVPVFGLFYVLLGASTCPFCGPVSYPEAFLASLEATFYPVRPVGFEEFWPQLLSIIQRVVSPILLALLALALRQRVKR